MKARLLPFLIAILLLSISCKKEKLENDTAILIGKWNWTHTVEITQYCEVESLWNYDTIQTVTNDNQYELEFLEKGKIKFYHNDGLIWNHRLVFNDANQESFNTGPYDYKFEIWLNNKSGNLMEVWVGSDALMVHDYPYDTEYHCTEYLNHFVRE